MAVFLPMPVSAQMTLLAVAAMLMLVTASFAHLTVEDIGDAIEVRFGPLPLIKTRVPYESIESVTPERTTLLDGWGLHYARGGWLYNVWGYDCVKIVTSKKTLRVGTDDVENLTDFLKGFENDAA